MSTNTRFDKSRLPSRHVTEGPERAPHRSYYYAMGMTEEEIHQPLVGVATCWNEAAPCNIALNRQAQAVKVGVKAQQGTPREFTTITVTDGIAMRHEGMRSSLASREAIADTVELTMRGHCYDAIVGLAGCDKSLPGMMMAMLRLNVPSVFLYGGSILPGKVPEGADVPADFASRDLTVQDVFEAVGNYQNGSMSQAALEVLERVACPTAGACGGQFTANTMACVSEAIGLALLNSSGMPAPYESRDAYAAASGEAVMNLIEKNIRARDICTREAFENAARIVACTGGSTNAGLPLPAMAAEAGIDFNLSDVCDIFRDTPYFVDMKPGGSHVAKDLYDAGGVPVVMKELRKAGLLHDDCLTASGLSIGEELDKIEREADGKVIHAIETPISKTGGVVGLKGNLAPEGAIVKIAGMSEEDIVFTGPALIFECEQDAFEAVQNRAYSEGDDHGGPVRSRHGQKGGTDHRRPFLRRDTGFLRWSRRPRSRTWRTDCLAQTGRHDHAERDHRFDLCRYLGRGNGRAQSGLARCPQNQLSKRCTVEIRAACGPNLSWCGDASRREGGNT